MKHHDCKLQLTPDWPSALEEPTTTVLVAQLQSIICTAQTHSTVAVSRIYEQRKEVETHHPSSDGKQCSVVKPNQSSVHCHKSLLTVGTSR